MPAPVRAVVSCSNSVCRGDKISKIGHLSDETPRWADRESVGLARQPNYVRFAHTKRHGSIGKHDQFASYRSVSYRRKGGSPECGSAASSLTPFAHASSFHLDRDGGSEFSHSESRRRVGLEPWPTLPLNPREVRLCGSSMRSNTAWAKVPTLAWTLCPAFLGGNDERPRSHPPRRGCSNRSSVSTQCTASTQ